MLSHGQIIDAHLEPTNECDSIHTSQAPLNPVSVVLSCEPEVDEQLGGETGAKEEMDIHFTGEQEVECGQTQ